MLLDSPRASAARCAACALALAVAALLTAVVFLLVGEDFSAEEVRRVSGFLAQCQSPDGGFAGGPLQIAHLAPTYAAVNALITMNNEDALKVGCNENMICCMHRGIRSALIC